MKKQLDEEVPTPPFVSILHREHAKYLNDKVKDEDLSFGLFPLLIAIYRNEDIYQEELAHAFRLNESTITRNLKKLEDKGFIERIPQKRKKLIKITKKGAITAQKVMNYDEEWDNQIIGILGEEEYINFKSAFKKICDELM